MNVSILLFSDDMILRYDAYLSDSPQNKDFEGQPFQGNFKGHQGN